MDTNLTETSNATENKEPNKGIANLRPWQPGQSGNPGGRPKKKPITEAYEKLLEDPAVAAEMAKAMFDVIRARGKGTVLAAKELTDRVEGRVIESVEHTGEGGGPVKFSLEIIGE